jgi:hypothetical protein
MVELRQFTTENEVQELLGGLAVGGVAHGVTFALWR